MIKHLSFLTTTALLLSSTSVYAQTYQPSNRSPVADSTLGTQVSGTGNNFNITGGVNKGQTLFHSFTDFSVPTNGAAKVMSSGKMPALSTASQQSGARRLQSSLHLRL